MFKGLMSETCWAHKKWNKIASDINLVFHSSTITMMHGPINIKLKKEYLLQAFYEEECTLNKVLHMICKENEQRTKTHNVDFIRAIIITSRENTTMKMLHTEQKLDYILIIKPTRCTNFSNLFLE